MPCYSNCEAVLTVIVGHVHSRTSLQVTAVNMKWDMACIESMKWDMACIETAVRIASQAWSPRCYCQAKFCQSVNRPVTYQGSRMITGTPRVRLQTYRSSGIYTDKKRLAQKASLSCAGSTYSFSPLARQLSMVALLERCTCFTGCYEL
jgi:hypothetical protein